MRKRSSCFGLIAYNAKSRSISESTTDPRGASVTAITAFAARPTEGSQLSNPAKRSPLWRLATRIGQRD